MITVDTPTTETFVTVLTIMADGNTLQSCLSLFYVLYALLVRDNLCKDCLVYNLFNKSNIALPNVLYFTKTLYEILVTDYGNVCQILP